MTLLRDKADLPAYYRAAGRQVGKELAAAVDAWNNRARDAATLQGPPMCHPAYVEGLRMGYREAIGAPNPIKTALSEAI